MDKTDDVRGVAAAMVQTEQMHNVASAGCACRRKKGDAEGEDAGETARDFVSFLGSSGILVV